MLSGGLRMLRRGGVRGLHRAATTPTAARLQPRAAVGARGLHQGTRVVRANAILEADQTNFGLSFYHKINNTLLVLTPVAMVLAPSSLCMPVDLALGVLFPLHSHIAMNFVITDYVPKITSSAGAIMGVRVLMLGLTGVMAVGLFRLNTEGVGLTTTLKSLWKPA